MDTYARKCTAVPVKHWCRHRRTSGNMHGRTAEAAVHLIALTVMPVLS